MTDGMNELAAYGCKVDGEVAAEHFEKVFDKRLQCEELDYDGDHGENDEDVSRIPFSINGLDEAEDKILTNGLDLCRSISCFQHNILFFFN